MNGIGERLRQKREELGLTIEQAAEATKFRPELIRAVEDGRAGLFSAGAHRNGFVRTYAKVLGLDGDALVRDQKTEEERAQEALRGIRPKPTGGPKLRRVAVILIVVAVVAVAVSVVVNLIGRGRPAADGDRGADQVASRVERAEGDVLKGGGGAGGAAGAAGARGAGGAPEMDYVPAPRSAEPAAGGEGGNLPGGGYGLSGGSQVRTGSGEQGAASAWRESPAGGGMTGGVTGAESGAVADSARVRALEVAAERHSVFLILRAGDQEIYDGWIYRGTRKVFRGSGEFVIVSLSSSEGVSVMLDGRQIALPESLAEDKSVADWPVPANP
jgi:cytoskeleton protein RodZ